MFKRCNIHLKTLLIISLFLFNIGSVQSAPFVVNKILIEGNKRIGKDTIHNYLPFELGEQITETKVSDIIKSLHKTNFFSNIKIYQLSSNTLVIHVKERPHIAKINIEGNVLIKTDDMNSILDFMDVKKGRVFNHLMLDRIILDLKRRYQNQGYYSSKISIKVKKLPRRRVELNLKIIEGIPATIGNINIVGNYRYTDKKLKSNMLLSENSIFVGAGKYSKPKLQSDIEKVRSLYMDNGYAKFKILSSQVSLSLDLSKVHTTLNLEEGKLYHFSKITFSGETILKKSVLKKLISVKEKKVFSRVKVITSLNTLRDQLSEEGYAFASINPITNFDDENRKIAINFHIDPKEKVYVNKVIIENNTRTQGHVIRREMRQYEKAPYSLKDMRQSKIRLQRLGFFKTVNIETQRISKNLVNLVVTVSEQPTGSFNASITYGQLDGIGFKLGLSERNTFGSGNKLNISTTYNSSRHSASIGITDPYYTEYGVSLGVGVFYSRIINSTGSNTSISDYSINRLGLSTNISYPTSEYSKLNYELKIQTIDLVCKDAFVVCNDFVKENGDPKGSFVFTSGWSYNNTNKFYFPSKGGSTSISLQHSQPIASKISYQKVFLNGASYLPLSRIFTLKLKSSFVYGTGFNGGLPFYTKLYTGGIGSLRGFKANSIGNHYDIIEDGSDNPKGGNIKLANTAAIVFPMPFVDDSSNMRISLFFDFANIYDDLSEIKLSSMPSSTGLGLSWITPVGPLSFSFSNPITYTKDDDLQKFQFTLGRQF